MRYLCSEGGAIVLRLPVDRTMFMYTSTYADGTRHQSYARYAHVVLNNIMREMLWIKLIAEEPSLIRNQGY